MRIKYLDGYRLYYAVLVGGNSVIEDQNYLNKINVFPVPDSDTGTNLASTMRSIAEGAVPARPLSTTLRSIADAALSGARGNSGLIFAQFLYGVNEEVKDRKKISTQTFGEAVKKAINYAYKAIVSPVEGTMITVMKDWADEVYRQRIKKGDFVELLSDSLQVAQKSLRETPLKLAVLAKAGVVDAGAKGFVDFLEGITNFIRKGRLKNISKPKISWEESNFPVHSPEESVGYRYCSEALLTGENMDLDRIRKEIQSFGDSAIVAGSQEKARIHIHTDNPADLFFRLKNYGSITQIKADDMLKQHEVSFKRKSEIALVTDSSCDLPQGIIDDFQVHVIPFSISIGDSLFLDKITITPEQFYTLLKTHREFPTSSQPSPKTVQSLFSFLASHYESIIVIHISGKLSGAFKLSKEAASVFKEKKISLIDSRQLSASLGLIVLRTAEAIKDGNKHEDIVELVEDWIIKTKILVDIQTLEYMVRGGRVSPIKGLLAKILNLKPIISLDDEGKATASGKSFSRKGNMTKILSLAEDFSRKGEIWNYSIVHAQNLKRAKMYAEELERRLRKNPAYILDISPVIGVHNGIGAVGIALMLK
jgi:DegV family protein with EDD domain